MLNFWTLEKIDALRQGVAAGHSFSAIARDIGSTRNAAIGKWKRLEAREAIATGRATAPRKRNRPAPVARVVPAQAPAAVAVPPIPSPPVGIADVTGCKWAIGEDASLPGGHAFCNHHKSENSPYCAYHKRKAIAPYSLELRKKTLGPLGLRFGKAAA